MQTDADIHNWTMFSEWVLWSTQSSMGCLHQILHSELRKLYRRGDRKTVKARKDGWLPWKDTFQTQEDWCTYEFMVTVGAHTGHIVEARWDPVTEREKWTKGLTPNQEAIFSWYLLEMGNQFSLMGYHYVYHPHFRADPCFGFHFGLVFFCVISFLIVLLFILWIF